MGYYATRSELKREIATVSGGGVPDGDKGDVTVSSSGTVWTVEPTLISGAIATHAADNDAHGPLTLENRTSDPGSPVTGQMWLRTDV